MLLLLRDYLVRLADEVDVGPVDVGSALITSVHFALRTDFRQTVTQLPTTCVSLVSLLVLRGFVLCPIFLRDLEFGRLRSWSRSREAGVDKGLGGLHIPARFQSLGCHSPTIGHVAQRLGSVD